MNIFWFSFSISLQNIRKKGTSWILSNISPKKRVHRYLQNTIFNFKLKFHPEDGLVEQRYFELFFSAWSIFSSYKRSLLIEAVFTLFYICCNFGQIFCPEVIQLFLWQIWELFRNSKRASNMNWRFFWMRNRGLLLPSFCTFLCKGRPQPIVQWCRCKLHISPLCWSSSAPPWSDPPDLLSPSSPRLLSHCYQT